MRAIIILTILTMAVTVYGKNQKTTVVLKSSSPRISYDGFYFWIKNQSVNARGLKNNSIAIVKGTLCKMENGGPTICYPYQEKKGILKVTCSGNPDQFFQIEIKKGLASFGPEQTGFLYSECEPVSDSIPVEISFRRLPTLQGDPVYTLSDELLKTAESKGEITNKTNWPINQEKRSLYISAYKAESNNTKEKDARAQASAKKQKAHLNKQMDKAGYPLTEYLFKPCLKAQMESKTKSKKMSQKWMPKKGKLFSGEDAAYEVVGVISKKPLQIVIEGVYGQFSEAKACYAVFTVRDRSFLNTQVPPNHIVKIGDKIQGFQVKATGKMRLTQKSITDIVGDNFIAPKFDLVSPITIAH